jgi:hypothetical protein
LQGQTTSVGDKTPLIVNLMGNIQSNQGMEPPDTDISEAPPANSPFRVVEEDSVALYRKSDERLKKPAVGQVGLGAAFVTALVGVAFLWHQRREQDKARRREGADPTQA